MKASYVDSSCIVAILFEETDHPRLRSKLESAEELFSSNLLEAEVRAALAREGFEAHSEAVLDGISWVHPDRPLTPEFEAVLASGFLRGADLFHVATALYLKKQVGDLELLSLDTRQLEVGHRLGLT